MIFNQKQAGLTLIEMMIAMVLGLFVTAVIITVFSTNVRSSTENIKMIRLNQELRGVMTMMVDELKRHGYSSDSTNVNFMDDFSISSTCARYSYDETNRDPAGSETDGVRDADERFGFELNGSTIMWARDFTSTDCSSSTTPTSITDPNLASIVTLDFTTSIVNIGGTNVHMVEIELVGETTLPHSVGPVKRTIIETVRIRNYDPG